jgi:acyl carrier protein phosphodiesterase
MNFLAHFLLVQHNESWIVGNYIADFIKGNAIYDYPAEVQEGIRVHRAIDTFTDQHPVVLQGVRRLRERHSKYAPVLVDVYYDYVLSLHWEKYTDQELQDFTRSMYAVLESHAALLPESFQRRLEFMIADDWLMRYTNLEGLEEAFHRIKRRASKPELFDRAVDSLLAHLPALEEEFQLFFPELIGEVTR